MCLFIWGRNDIVIIDIGLMFGFYIFKGEWKLNGFVYRFDVINIMIIFRWMVSFGEVYLFNVIDFLIRNVFYFDCLEEFLRDYIDELDVVVLNMGYYWNGGKKKLNWFDYYY